MKKDLFLLAFAFTVANGAFASTTSGSTEIAKVTYYGTKSVPYGDYPCKGNTTRKCAVIEETFTECQNGNVQIERKIFDGEGQFIRQTTDLKHGSLEMVKEAYKQQGLQNGGVFELHAEPMNAAKP